ncbi:hypothetical protein DSLASN_48100 [Desulfoluna limicola]|uniref:C_GCAxxG_C_C family protein n=1 Tax=Desulfoluna limicola TaxID=2810562 RepID=A0ABN6FDC2_9BACT|nr:C-GCAxxG-C-C family protein [Desulfoluna limicola]BCS99178.1 hypothetical protein DSLASN_48100 [Desulfoluna limicola]
MKNRTDIAVQKFLDGYNCSQAVFFSFCDDLEIEKNLALKLASGFGAGMGRKQEICGAVSGGILVIGTAYGRGEHEDRSAMELSYKKTQILMDRFTAKHGTLSCRDLLNQCELTTKEGQLYFKENDLLRKKCIPCVKSVVETVEELL